MPTNFLNDSSFDLLKTIGSAYLIAVGVSAVLALARFSKAFLILRPQSAGLPLAFAPLVLVIRRQSSRSLLWTSLLHRRRLTVH